MRTELARAAKDRSGGLLVVGALLAVMWGVEVVDVAAGDLDRFGIVPRDGEGLDGILWAPFLHAGFGHLIANSVPFALLGALIALSGLVRLLSVVAITALVGGLGTWLTAPAGSVTVGASGVVFGFVTYLVARGAWSRSVLHLAAGLAVALTWGWTVLFGLVPTAGVSWQGHLFGAVGGVVAARVLHRRRPALTA